MKKVESLRAKITAQQGRKVELELIDDLDVEEAIKRRYNGKYYAVLDVFDPNSITDEQRKHFFALMGDYEEYTGTPLEAASSWFKYQFMIDKQLDEFPSLARNAMDRTVASQLLEFTIVYFIEHGIPFRKQQFYISMDTSKMLFALTMKRICVVCGRPNSDLHHHENLVSMGRDRQKIDHTQSKFLSLCREHHQECHNIGLKSFEEKYHIKPIKLSKDNLKELNVL